MMTLSTTTSYAIQALTSLAAPDFPRAMIADIARRAGVPAAYLAKIMKRLNDAGIVDSKRGSKGGIWLARAPAKITLLEIMNAVDGADYLDGCLLGREICSDERACPTHAFWKPLRAKIRAQLSALTLAEILVFEESRKPVSRQPAARRPAAAKRAR